MYLRGRNRFIETEFVLQDSHYANTRIMRRCTRAAAEIVFVLSGFNEPTSFIFVAKDRHFFEEQGFESQIVPAQRPRRRFGHGRFK
jgi:hypothetical protein